MNAKNPHFAHLQGNFILIIILQLPPQFLHLGLRRLQRLNQPLILRRHVSHLLAHPLILLIQLLHLLLHAAYQSQIIQRDIIIIALYLSKSPLVVPDQVLYLHVLPFFDFFHFHGVLRVHLVPVQLVFLLELHFGFFGHLVEAVAFFVDLFRLLELDGLDDVLVGAFYLAQLPLEVLFVLEQLVFLLVEVRFGVLERDHHFGFRLGEVVLVFVFEVFDLLAQLLDGLVVLLGGHLDLPVLVAQLRVRFFEVRAGDLPEGAQFVAFDLEEVSFLALPLELFFQLQGERLELLAGHFGRVDPVDYDRGGLLAPFWFRTLEKSFSGKDPTKKGLKLTMVVVTMRSWRMCQA